MKRRHLIFSLIILIMLSSCNRPVATPTLTTTEAPVSQPTVDIPVTGVNSPSPVPIQTLIDVVEFPTATSTSTPTTVLASPREQPVNCRFGPDVSYAVIGALIVGRQAEVIGKNIDVTWVYVRNPSDPSTSCWLSMDFVTLVHEYLSVSAIRYPDKVAVAHGNDRMTYRSLDRLSDGLAGFLSQTGVKRHDRVVVFLDNSTESVVALYRILKAGAVFVILNGTIKPRKLAYILNDSGAAAIVTHTAKARVVREALAEVKIPVTLLWVGDPSGIPSELPGSSASWSDITTLSESIDGKTGV